MNILLTSDDGPKATGLKLLKTLTERTFSGRSITTIVPEKPYTGASMSCTANGSWDHWKDAKATQVENQFYTIDLTPSDIIYRAFHQQEQFTGRPWDLVLVGINHGSNLGFDVYHSGTCAAAMVAAAAFGCCAWAFSQDLPEPSNYKTEELPTLHFEASEKMIPDFMRKNQVAAGECWNVNIPKKAEMGYKSVKVAHYSRHRMPPTKLVPRAREEQSDITALEQGFVTVSELQLRVNPSLRY